MTNDESKRFRSGDLVWWKSQAQGSTKEKRGVVAEVVPAGQMPNYDLFPELYKYSGVGSSRNHESYVITVKGKRTAVHHYWPRVTHLRMLTEEEE